MNDENKEGFGNSELGKGLGCAAIILALLLGMSGCYLLVSIGDSLRKPAPQAEEPHAR